MIHFFKIFEELNQHKYKLGSAPDGKEGTLDCFGLIYKYNLLRTGKRMPTSFEGKDFGYYASMYKYFPDLAKDAFLRYLSSKFKAVNKNYHRTGDILACDINEEATIGIATANAGMLTISEELGAVFVRQDNYKIDKVFRCPGK